LSRSGDPESPTSRIGENIWLPKLSLRPKVPLFRGELEETSTYSEKLLELSSDSKQCLKIKQSLTSLKSDPVGVSEIDGKFSLID